VEERIRVPGLGRRSNELLSPSVQFVSKSRPSVKRSVAGLVDFNGPVARKYDHVRALSPEALEGLRSNATCHAPVRVQRVLDLGSGTGRFSPSLAGWFC